MKKLKVYLTPIFVVCAFAVVDLRAQGPQFRVGDHVIVDTNMTSSSSPDDRQRWMPATVIEVDQRAGYRPAYTVRVDGTAETHRIPITPNPAEKVWIRAGGNNRTQNPGNGGAGGGEPVGAAPANSVQFNVGDRVEADILKISTSSAASMQLWKNGTISQVDHRAGYRPGYFVLLDPEPGQLPVTQWFPMIPNSTERIWLKPSGAAAAQIETNKLKVDNSGTILADRDPLDCFNFQQPGGARNGSAVPVDLAKKLVRCALGENPSAQGGGGAKIVDIADFQIGAPRRWDRTRDGGAGGTAETIVYPVRVSFSSKAFYREQNIVLSGQIQMFTCDVQLSEWICGPDQAVKPGTQRRIMVVP
jgi:hypothetical protein